MAYGRYLSGCLSGDQSKRLRWLDHRTPDDGLLQKLLFGQVKGGRPPGCPRSSFNDVAVHELSIAISYKDAHNRLLWRNQTCTYLAHHDLESVNTILFIKRLIR